MVFINKKIHEMRQKKPQDIQQHLIKLMQISIIVSMTFFFLKRPFPAVFVAIKTGIFSLNVMFNSYQVGFVPKTEAKFHHRET